MELKHTCIDCKACEESDRRLLEEVVESCAYQCEPLYTFTPVIDFVDILQGYMDGLISMDDLNQYITIINDEIEVYTELLESAMAQRNELDIFDHSQEIDLGGC